MTDNDAKIIAAAFAFVSIVAKGVAASNGRWDHPRDLPTEDEIAELDPADQALARKRAEKEKSARLNAKRWLDWSEAATYATGVVAAGFALYALL
ncbi:hypothetical protein [Brachybacterium massiliense]|uniref:hypothetical protein n=1 Tax=Brachybacterium massiliense TaxID=1755098 RepID=UPI000B3BB23E|nr:hypothetical protein [Brachybacterium massiliense]